MENIEIAEILDDVAALLEIQGANPFRIRAYQNAARTVEAHAVAMHKMLADGESLTELPGVGKQVAKHIEELVDTGKLSVIEEIAKEIPLSLIELTRLSGVGPKKARAVWESLGVETVDDLERVLKEGAVADLKGFGKKTQEKILKAIDSYRKRQQGRTRLADAEQYVEPLVAYMQKAPGLDRLEVAGSYRRRKETIRDVDLLAIADDPDPVMDHVLLALLVPGLFILLGAWQVFGGFGVMLKKPIGARALRYWARIVVIVTLTLTVAIPVLVFMGSGAVAQESAPGGNTQAFQLGLAVGTFLLVGIIALISLIWPIIILIWFRREKIQDQIESWG